MSDVIDLDTKKNKIFKLLGEATPADREPKNKSKLITLFAFGLVGTTIPSPAANLFFGALSAGLLIALTANLIRQRKDIPHQRTRLIALGIVTALTLSGCSGISALWADDPIPVVVLKDHKEFKTGHRQGIGLFGFGLDDITPESAMKDGGITEAYATQESRSYGWISVARVRVYGK